MIIRNSVVPAYLSHKQAETFQLHDDASRLCVQTQSIRIFLTNQLRQAMKLLHVPLLCAAIGFCVNGLFQPTNSL